MVGGFDLTASIFSRMFQFVGVVSGSDVRINLALKYQANVHKYAGAHYNQSHIDSSAF